MIFPTVRHCCEECVKRSGRSGEDQRPEPRLGRQNLNRRRLWGGAEIGDDEHDLLAVGDKVS